MNFREQVQKEAIFTIMKYDSGTLVLPMRSGETEEFVTEKIENLTTNLSSKFEEWIKDNY